MQRLGCLAARSSGIWVRSIFNTSGSSTQPCQPAHQPSARPCDPQPADGERTTAIPQIWQLFQPQLVKLSLESGPKLPEGNVSAAQQHAKRLRDSFYLLLSLE